MVPISASIEAQIADMPEEDKKLFLEDMGMDEPGLDRVIRAAYQLLGLHTYFTAGPKEVRAWTIPAGATAPQAAGAIHTDFERGFIRAEVASYDDFVAAAASRARRSLASCAWRARTTLCVTETSFTFASTSDNEPEVRDRGLAERGKVDALQRAHQGRGSGRELSVLHRRAERRHRRSA